MSWLNTRYKQLGLGLVLLYALLQAAVIYGYYFPPVSAREWTTTLATILPWIGGVELIGTLNFIGERLSFTMATAYVPGLLLGLLVGLRELIFNSGSWPRRAGWLDAVACLLVAGVIVLVHYLGYWQKSYWGNHPQFAHTFIALYSPVAAGFFTCGFAFRFKQLFLNIESFK